MKPGLKLLFVRLSLAVLFSVILVVVFIPNQRLFAVIVLAPLLTVLAYVFDALKR